MAGVGRNLSLAALMAAILAVATVALPSAMWACAVAALLGLAGVVLFRGNGWRTAALLVAALALSLTLLDAFAGLFTARAVNQGLVRVTDPRWWPPPDPVLGFRPRPDSQVVHTATYDGQPVYKVTYHFGADGARVTPPAPAGADTYLFMGDSFMFGQGIPDDKTLASQFATATGTHTVNLGVLGNAPNHLVRAFEAGLLDRYKGEKVKAVVVWIIPAQLARVTGDGSWLGDSPRYVLEGDTLRHTGSFNEYRLKNPLEGARYLLGQQFPFIDAIGRQQRQDEQADLFVAMMARLKAFAREKFEAPLVIVYSWPDEKSTGVHGTSEFAQGMLVDILARVRKLGVEMVRVDDITNNLPVEELLIPHDGHPSAYSNALIADALKKRLVK